MRGTDNWSWGATEAEARWEISRLFTLTRCCKSQYSVLNRDNTAHRNRCKIHQVCCFHSLLNDSSVRVYLPGIGNILDSSAGTDGFLKLWAPSMIYTSSLGQQRYWSVICVLPTVDGSLEKQNGWRRLLHAANVVVKTRVENLDFEGSKKTKSRPGPMQGKAESRYIYRNPN